MDSAEGAEEKVWRSFFLTPIYEQPLFISNPWAKISTPDYKQRALINWGVEGLDAAGWRPGGCGWVQGGGPECSGGEGVLGGGFRGGCSGVQGAG